MSIPGSLNFARVMGSIGSIVVPGVDDAEDDDFGSLDGTTNQAAIDMTSPRTEQLAEAAGGSVGSEPGPA